MVLRPAEEKDVEALHKIINEPDVIAFMPLPRPVSLERVELWFCSAPRIGLEIFVIQDAGAVVGCATLARDGRISLWLREAAQGKGLGAVALSELMQRAREKGLGVAKAECFHDNLHAITFFEKAGFSRVSEDGESIFLERRP